MSSWDPKIAYEFGGFRFDPASLQLVHEGRAIPLTAKSSDTLLALVEHANQVLPKEELIARVWPGTAVEENNLNQQISVLRKALSANTADVVIETIPRRGYRLLANVRKVDAVPVSPGRNEAVTVTPVPVSPRKPGVRTIVVAAVVTVAAGSFIAWRAYDQWSVRRDSRETSARGDSFLAQGNIKAALTAYQEAVALDPGNARAYSAMAHALNKAGAEGLRFVSRDAPSPSVEAARRGVAVDPACGVCQGTLGFFLFYHQWNFIEAEEHFREALRLAPDQESILPPLAMLYSVSGRTDEAIRLIDSALEKRPFVLSWVAIRAATLYMGRRYDDVISAADRAVLIDSKDPGSWTWRSNALFQLGRGDEAVRALTRSIFIDQAKAIEGALEKGGVRGGLLALLDASKEEPLRTRYSWRRGVWLARLNEVDRALDELELAVRTRNLNAIYIAADPAYDSIRDHPRFKQLSAALNLHR